MPLLETKNALNLASLVEIECVSEINVHYFQSVMHFSGSTNLQDGLFSRFFMKSDVVHVAVGIIYSATGDILISQREEKKHMGGFWEFPGGKVETGETSEQALSRELKEELDIFPVNYERMTCISHNYSGKKLLLHVWKVFTFHGRPIGREGQTIKWIQKDELVNYAFPPANLPVISSLRLPETYAITGHFSSLEALRISVNHQLEQGIRLIRFRADTLNTDTYLHTAQALSQLCHQFKAQLLMTGKPELLELLLNETWCNGIHLKAKTAVELHKSNWQYPNDRLNSKWLAVSCHNIEEIKIAEAIGAHFITLSPVHMTSSHRSAVPLGTVVAEEMTRKTILPVYWLGGMGVRHIPQALAASAQGVAAISEFWPESTSQF